MNDSIEQSDYAPNGVWTVAAEHTGAQAQVAPPWAMVDHQKQMYAGGMMSYPSATPYSGSPYVTGTPGSNLSPPYSTAPATAGTVGGFGSSPPYAPPSGPLKASEVPYTATTMLPSTGSTFYTGQLPTTSHSLGGISYGIPAPVVQGQCSPAPFAVQAPPPMLSPYGVSQPQPITYGAPSPMGVPMGFPVSYTTPPMESYQAPLAPPHQFTGPYPVAPSPLASQKDKSQLSLGSEGGVGARRASGAASSIPPVPRGQEAMVFDAVSRGFTVSTASDRFSSVSSTPWDVKSRFMFAYRSGPAEFPDFVQTGAQEFNDAVAPSPFTLYFYDETAPNNILLANDTNEHPVKNFQKSLKQPWRCDQMVGEDIPEDLSTTFDSMTGTALDDFPEPSGMSAGDGSRRARGVSKQSASKSFASSEYYYYDSYTGSQASRGIGTTSKQVSSKQPAKRKSGRACCVPASRESSVARSATISHTASSVEVKQSAKYSMMNASQQQRGTMPSAHAPSMQAAAKSAPQHDTLTSSQARVAYGYQQQPLVAYPLSGPPAQSSAAMEQRGASHGTEGAASKPLKPRKGDRACCQPRSSSTHDSRFDSRPAAVSRGSRGAPPTDGSSYYYTYGSGTDRSHSRGSAAGFGVNRSMTNASEGALTFALKENRAKPDKERELDYTLRKMYFDASDTRKINNDGTAFKMLPSYSTSYRNYPHVCFDVVTPENMGDFLRVKRPPRFYR
eukprot:Polyplicarium_translucidae@DN1343_c0_g1_i1.p1